MKQMIGRVNNESVHVDTNIQHLNPLSASAILLPIVDGKQGKEINIPYKPDIAITGTHAFESYYQFLLKGSLPSPLRLRMTWDEKIPYELPTVKNNVALKIDGLMSVIAYRMVTKIEVIPFMIAYSQTDNDEKIKWAKKMGIKDIAIIYIDYDRFSDYLGYMDKYENWIVSTISAYKTSLVWLAIPPLEISNYFPDQTVRMMTEGSDWLSRVYERRILIESPFMDTVTRTDIVKKAIDDKIISKDLMYEAIRCKCGNCFECIMNRAMIRNLDMDESVFNAKLNNIRMMKRIQKLIELDKIHLQLVDEIKSVIYP